MNISIKKVFKNITVFGLIITIWLALLSFLSFTQKVSFSIDNNLQNQKDLIHFMRNLDHNSIDMSQIQFDGKNEQLKFELEKIKKLIASDIVGDMLIGSNGEMISEYDQLMNYYTKFSKEANNYFFSKAEDDIQKLKENMFNSTYAMIDHINVMINVNNNKTEEKFKLQEYLIYFVFIFSVIVLFWYSNRLSVIYKDIQYLFSIKDSSEYTISTNEVNSISRRMSSKPTTKKDDPLMIDSVTDMKNMQGVLSSHADIKMSKSHTAQEIALFAIDDIKLLREKYPSKVINSIFKKVAFVISLHEQHNDVVGFVSDNTFVFIFSQKNKNESLEVCEEIRDTISKSHFKIDQDREISLTISSIVVTKLAGKSLENMLTQSKEKLNEFQLENKNKVKYIK